ncbi:type II toxin-antitoxin system HigA family antitoxin [Bacteroidota bacterium]
MLKPIKNEKQYEDALERIYILMHKDIKPNSAESDELEILSILVEKYEEEKYSIAAPIPIEAIKFRMEQMGLEKKDMVEYLGYRSRVSEIFSGKRKLSLKMIKNLHKNLGVPARSLLGD